MLLSLFCGAGGLDLGFERQGFKIGLAFDRNADSVRSYNENRLGPSHGHVADVSTLTIRDLDRYHRGRFAPTGVIGGPPCQSFSQANVNQVADDPRHVLPLAFASLVKKLNNRSPIDFFVMENVVGFTLKKHKSAFDNTTTALSRCGFNIKHSILNARDFGTPQSRDRLFIVGFNRRRMPDAIWQPPEPTTSVPLTVRETIYGLPVPTYFKLGLTPDLVAHHPNHWCMQPKSPKFSRPGALVAGDVKSRSFKTLDWDKPSIAVAYGHREVHVHPDGTRRLSVYEAMLLQGFPRKYQLFGSLSSQIRQVSEAVPEPLASAVAASVYQQLQEQHRHAVSTTSSGRIGKPLSQSRQLVVS